MRLEEKQMNGKTNIIVIIQFYEQKTYIANNFPTNGKSITKGLESLDMIIDSMIQKAEGTGFTCKVCGITRKTTQSLKVHVEGMHVTGFSHPCLKCDNGKTYKSRKSLRVHLFNKHKM